MRPWITVIVLLISFGFVMAGGCDPSDTSCFLCGGVSGEPCTTNCPTGPDRPGLGHVACECPQGKACICYCPAKPYNPQTEDKCTGVVCANKCQNGAFSIGTCDPADGKCKYVQREVCAHGCDTLGLRCVQGYAVNDEICDYVKGENCVDSKLDCACPADMVCKFGDPEADEIGCVQLNPEAENEGGNAGCKSSAAILAVLAGALVIIRRK
ncbi:MAG: hypothetical protein PHV13_00590 [Candidatus ainarchaeum sp.]|nr:hypothetical protein [Candidatus ainarchaeum sp.]